MHHTTQEDKLDRIIRPAELADHLGVSKPTLWRMRRRGEIPEPLRISRGAVGWCESTIRRWLDKRSAEAQEEQAKRLRGKA